MPAARACARCSVRTGSVDETGLCLICREVGDATDLRVIVARAVWAIARDKADKAAKADARGETPTTKTITVDDKKIGPFKLSEVLADLDLLERPLSAADFDRLCHTLAKVRHAVTKQRGAATFSVDECAPLRSLEGKGLRPSEMVAALRWAAADPFWSRQRISFRVLAEHGQTWAANATKTTEAGTSTPQRRAQLQAEIARLSTALRAENMPIAAVRAADEADDYDSSAPIETVAAHLEALRKTAARFAVK